MSMLDLIPDTYFNDIEGNALALQKRQGSDASALPNEVRNMKVMLDCDLAELYDIKPIRLREQVKRNIDRFPDGFMVSQNAIPSKQHLCFFHGANNG